MRFCTETLGFSHCCGARYIKKGTTWDKNPGVMLSLEKPFEEAEGEECVTVETSYGTIYLRFQHTHYDHHSDRVSNFANPNWIRGMDYETGSPESEKTIQYEVQSKFWKQGYDARGERISTFTPPTEPGAVVLIQSLDRATVRTEKILEDLGDRVIYKSEPFYNLYHYDRKHKSLELIIFEVKEPEHEIQAGL